MYAHNITAVTAVSRTTFVSGQNVRGTSVRVTQDQIQTPHVTQGAPAMVPTRESRLGPNAVSNRIPPATLANRAVVTKMAPAPQVIPIGHTQSFGSSGGFKPGARPGSNQLGPPPNANNNRAPNGVTNGQPNNIGRPGNAPPAGNNPNANANGSGNTKPNGQLNNNARPGFERPSGNNPSATGNVNPNAQPNNSGRPAFQPPSHNNPNANENGNPNAQSTQTPQKREQVQPPPKPPNPPKESKAEADKRKQQEKDQKDHQQ
jgi:hypothetical protein